MAYRSRVRYTSRKEKFDKNKRNFNVFFWFLVIFLVIWIIKDRQAIMDYIRTFFY